MQADGNGRHGATATRWPQTTGLHISSLLSGSAKQFSICPSHTAYPAGHCPTAPYISRKLSAVGWMCCSCLRANDISAAEMDQAASDEAPAGGGGLHEIKYDGYRMHGPQDNGKVKLLTHTDLDRSHLPNRSNSGGRLNGYILGGQSQKS
jgi:hypothetical protein